MARSEAEANDSTESSDDNKKAVDLNAPAAEESTSSKRHLESDQGDRHVKRKKTLCGSREDLVPPMSQEELVKSLDMDLTELQEIQSLKENEIKDLEELNKYVEKQLSQVGVTVSFPKTVLASNMKSIHIESKVIPHRAIPPFMSLTALYGTNRH
jgi:hypothetical protein